MRVVLDTNILARPAHNPQGPAAEVVERLGQAPHALLISAPILIELHRAMRYERVRRLHGFSDSEIDEYVTALEAIAILIELPESVPEPVVPADPDDDFVVATAVTGMADVICTRNRHFRPQSVREYCQARSIAILDDLELLALLRQE